MEELSQPVVKQRQSRPALLRTAAVLLFIYGFIEISDCITAVLMAFGAVSNPYPTMIFTEMQSMFDTQPVWLVPLFLFFTSLRITSAIGLWRNKMWGFWMAIIVSIVTVLIAPYLFPFASAEMLLDGIVLILLLIGYFGDMPISH